MRNASRPILLALICGTLWANLGAADRPLHLDKIKLPPGFKISVYARVPDARSMTLTPSGILFVGNRQEDSVYAVLPSQSGAKPVVVRIASGMRMPNGVAFRDGALYVAEVHRILKFPDIEKKLSASRPAVVYDGYPKDEHHGWKFIAFGPDGKLYVPVGAPCNICEPGDPYASITRINSDGTGLEIVARGIRNSVGFAWDPRTRDLWFTDNGRDNLGDEIPSDELNHASKAGLHFGYPYFHARGIPDPEYAKGKRRQDFVEPEQDMGPHVAALGMRFYDGPMFGPGYRGRIFVAQHGSWNRSKKIGYRVMSVKITDGKASGYETFASGWLDNGDVWGRPVDVQVMADGSMLVSDDFSGTIYRITK
jgi:glucose/arabinose dehydrogenase